MADKTCHTADLRNIKEAVCIDTCRVYDSCADKDCLTDLRVYLTDRGQYVLDNAAAVRSRGARILNCVVEVERVPFNRGFYAVDLTFFVKVTFDAFSCATAQPVMFDGLVVFGKKCVLYGSEGNVKIFSSAFSAESPDEQLPVSDSNPRAKVQTVEPVCLDAEICRICDCCSDNNIGADGIPTAVSRCFEGDFNGCAGEKALKVTLGVFTIVQLERDVQMLIPAYDFCVPKKECSCDTESPCDAFKRISFPIDEFFPPEKSGIDSAQSGGSFCGCGCGTN